MKELFNQHSLGLGIKEYKFESKNLHTQIFTRWNNLLQNSFKKEEQLQTDFLNDIFGEVLGYIYKRGEAESNLEKEEKTELDGQKPDGILGFFSGKAKDVRVIIELKDQKTNLDKSQNRATDKRSPIEQAFGYVAKYQGIEWVIASNFKEIRLYKANYAGKYHSFTIEELANDNNKIKEFYFLLAKNRLFTKTPNQSPVHSLNTSKKGEEIEKKFYQHYSKLREEIWHNLTKLNTEKHYGRNFYLYKAQKLIDRIVFIRFCKENGALDNDAVLEALNNKYIKGKYSRMKALFTAIDEGNPEIGIAKFNGGLFAEDKDLDSLEISDEIIDKIVILYSYNFGSDLDVNILGHIFEQSISDLENLTGDNEKKRKKDGVFYTPAYITEYIVKEAIGGWLADRKAEIGFTCPGVGEGEAKSRALCKKEKGEKEKWQAYAESLKSIKILDPACGSGAFLVKVFDYLQKEWQEVEKNLQIWHIKTDWNYQDILTQNIYGVDINPASVGITKLSLWLKTAHYREPLTTLDYNIKIGNSLIDDEVIAGYYSEFEGKIVSEIIQRQGDFLIDAEQLKKDQQDIDSYFKKSLAFKWEEEFPRVFKPETNSINLYHIVFATHNSRYSQRMLDVGIKINSLKSLDFSLEQEIVMTNIFFKISQENKATFRILAYNICKDHVHLLLCCQDSNLSNVTKLLKGKSAKLFNEYHQQINQQIWAQKYSSRLIRDDTQFESTFQYIQNNRSKHNLAENPNLKEAINRITADFHLQGIEKTFSSLIHSASEDRSDSLHSGLEDRSDSLHSATRGFNPLSSLTVVPNEIENKITDGRISPLTRTDKGLKPLVADRKGFDVVVGNPPYVDSETMTKYSLQDREYLTKNYEICKGNWDLYIPFYERAFKLTTNQGRVAFITPNKWLSIKYGEALRKFSLDYIETLVDASKTTVFENVGVFPVIVSLNKVKKENINVLLLQENPILFKEVGIVNKSNIDDNFGVILNPNFVILNRLKAISTKLSDFCDIQNPCSVSEAYLIKEQLVDNKSSNFNENEYFKFINTGTVEPYVSIWGLQDTTYIKDNYKYPIISKKWLKENMPRRFEQANSEKLIFSGMRHFEVLFDSNSIAGKSTTMALNFKINPQVLCAILNSKLIIFYMKQSYDTSGMDGGIGFTTSNISIIPIPQIPPTEQTPLISLSQKMLDLTAQFNELSSKFTRLLSADLGVAKITKKLEKWHNLEASEFFAEVGKQNKNFSLSQKSSWLEHFEAEKPKALAIQSKITQTDSEIDKMVYALYGLSEEEIAVVEAVDC